jgi:hypothetical protein
MAQYTLPHITTPTFVINSMADEWQTENILAPSFVTEPAVKTYAPFAPCIKDPTAGCNKTQAAQWLNFSAQFKDALAAARAASPADAPHGGVITSCPIHTTLISGLSHRIRVDGKTLYEHITAWMAAPPGPAAWTIDGDFPSNPTCPHAGATPFI